MRRALSLRSVLPRQSRQDWPQPSGGLLQRPLLPSSLDLPTSRVGYSREGRSEGMGVGYTALELKALKKKVAPRSPTPIETLKSLVSTEGIATRPPTIILDSPCGSQVEVATCSGSVTKKCPQEVAIDQEQPRFSATWGYSLVLSRAAKRKFGSLEVHNKVLAEKNHRSHESHIKLTTSLHETKDKLNGYRLLKVYRANLKQRYAKLKIFYWPMISQAELTRVNGKVSAEMKSSRPDRLHLGQARFVSAAHALQSSSPIKSGPIVLVQVSYPAQRPPRRQLRGHLDASSATMSLLENLPPSSSCSARVYIGGAVHFLGVLEFTLDTLSLYPFLRSRSSILWWRTVLHWRFSRSRKCRSETGKLKSVRGDRSDY
ncbi:hypothetical protein CR513_50173, partial [Mucuna pruriens]